MLLGGNFVLNVDKFAKKRKTQPNFKYKYFARIIKKDNSYLLPFKINISSHN
jgi:hypothetical protein